jgi:hypothetical protein
MGTFEIHGIAPGLPVDDLVAHSEGGPEAALRAAELLFPARRFELAAVDASASDDLWLRTHGPTTAILGRHGRDAEIPGGLGYFSFTHQTVSDAYAIEVRTPQAARFVVLSPGAVDLQEGDPLPFEQPFWAGAHDKYDDSAVRFDVADFASAAMLWMFGYDPAGPNPHSRVDPALGNYHTLREATPDHAPPSNTNRPSWLSRLLGRR